MARQILDSLLSRLHVFFDPEKLGRVLAEFLIDLAIAVTVMTLFYLIWRGLRWSVTEHLLQHFDRTSAAFTETVIKFTMFSIGLLAALNAAGVNTTTLLGSLGLAGLTIGFALRDTLSNIISGVLIFIDRPFTINDLVEIDGNYGRVERISLRTTRIITIDGKMLAVPNNVIMNKTVTSYTNYPHLRLDVAVTVAVTEDLDRARRVLLSLVDCDEDYLKQPLPAVVVTQLNDYNVVLELQAWLKDERLHIQKRFELREMIFKALTEANIQMPYETIQLSPHTVKVSTSSE